MHRRSLLHLVASAAFLPSAVESSRNLAWVAKVLKKMESVGKGDSRSKLLRVFKTEGGLSSVLQHTYVSKDCPYFKVDVTFRAEGRSERDPSGRETQVESEGDIIIKISRPYIAWSVAD